MPTLMFALGALIGVFTGGGMVLLAAIVAYRMSQLHAAEEYALQEDED